MKRKMNKRMRKYYIVIIITYYFLSVLCGVMLRVLDLLAGVLDIGFFAASIRIEANGLNSCSFLLQ